MQNESSRGLLAITDVKRVEMVTKLLGGCLAVCALIALQGCGGGSGSGGSGGSTATNASPGGIWTGSDPYNAADTLIRNHH